MNDNGNVNVLPELDFRDLQPQSIPVPIGKECYRLFEASGDAARVYRNSVLRSTKLGPDGKPVSVEGLADAEPLLVSKCLYKADGDFNVPTDGNGWPTDPTKLVHQNVIMRWPQRVQKGLYDWVMRVSGLNDAPKDGEETQAKNLLEATGPSSS